MGLRTAFNGTTNADGATVTNETAPFLSPHSGRKTWARSIQLLNTGTPSLRVSLDDGLTFFTVAPHTTGVPSEFTGVFRSLVIKSASAQAGAYSGSMELAA